MTLGARRLSAGAALSARLAADVAAFEAAGGTVQRPPAGISGWLRASLGVFQIKSPARSPAAPRAAGGPPGPKPRPRPQGLEEIARAAGAPVRPKSTVGRGRARFSRPRLVAILAMRAAGATALQAGNVVGMTREAVHSASRRAGEAERAKALEILAEARR